MTPERSDQPKVEPIPQTARDRLEAERLRDLRERWPGITWTIRRPARESGPAEKAASLPDTER